MNKINLENKYKVLGIIAEYDPFHNGHLKQLNLAKEKYDADFVVVVMSGPFLQRGETSLFSVEARTRMALNAGADLVFELPNLFALSDANRFAYGGINILNRLNFVQAISFGCEVENLNDLFVIFNYMSTKAFENNTLEFLNTGISYAKARSQSIEKALGKEYSKIFSKPNNILGICYINALNKLESKMDIIPVKRDTNYHSLKLNFQSPSAKFIRECIKNGNLSLASKCIPDKNLSIFNNEILNSKLSKYNSLDELILYKLRNISVEQLAFYPGVAEGLNFKIKKEVVNAKNLNELINSVKSKRYTHSRIRRLLSYILLNIDSGSINKIKQPDYVRLLGYNENAKVLFKFFTKSDIKIITNSNQLKEFNIQNDESAYDVWSLSSNSKIGMLYKTKMVITNR